MDRSVYTDLDRAEPVQGLEHDSESVWARFEALSSGVGFDATAPMSISASAAVGDPAFAPTLPAELHAHGVSTAKPIKRITVTEAMDEARRNRRVCPGQEAWIQLYEMLPDKRQTGPSWQPPPPVTGKVWAITPSISKRMCLRDHIEWADKHGCLNEVFAFLRSLPEDAWHHSE